MYHRLDDCCCETASADWIREVEKSTGAQVSAVGATSAFAESLAIASGSATCSSSTGASSGFAAALPVKENDSPVGGVHSWSLQACERISPTMLYFSPVTSKRCVSATLPVHQLRFMSKVSSCLVTGFLLGVKSPTSFTPSSLSHFTVSGLGPPSGSLSPYMCQPGSIVAVKVTAPCLSSVIFTDFCQLTGFTICAMAVMHTRQNSRAR